LQRILNQDQYGYYRQSKAYQQRLAYAGVTVEWVPLESLIDGYGVAHCMTQVLKRY